MSEPPSDYDSPWKEALESYFEAFMAFFFPKAHADIDWTKGYEFLDKELQQVVRDAELGRRRVDKLVKLWRRNGDEAFLLVHVEVQSQEETGFAERMYVYNYRLFDRYHRLVASFAVLGDERSGIRYTLKPAAQLLWQSGRHVEKLSKVLNGWKHSCYLRPLRL